MLQTHPASSTPVMSTHYAHNPPAYGLALATRGARVRVTEIRSDSIPLNKRLEGMGIYPGVLLEVVQQEGGGLIVRLNGSKIALGAGMAHRILVTDAS